MGPSFTRVKYGAFYAAAFMSVLTVFFWCLFFSAAYNASHSYTHSTQGVLTRLAIVEVADPVRIQGSTMTYYDVRYTYSVGGADYVGTRVDKKDTGPVPVFRVSPIIENKVGRPITVFYDPNDPSDSVLVQVNQLDVHNQSLETPLFLSLLAGTFWIVGFATRKYEAQETLDMIFDDD